MEEDQKKINNICIIAAVNNDEVLNSCLLASPDLHSGIQVNIQRGAKSAAEAYNAGIKATTAEIMVFVHQDVYLPQGWLDILNDTLKKIEKQDSNWGVLGLYGKDRMNNGHGHVYSTGLQRVLGKSFSGIIEVETLDEMVLILKRLSDLKFDESVPNFHLYGADICLQAKAHNMRSYVFPAFAIHNSNGIGILPKDYWKTYFAMRRKWKAVLPVMTPCMPISRWGAPVVHYMLRTLLKRRRSLGTRVSNPEQLWSRLRKTINQ